MNAPGLFFSWLVPVIYDFKGPLKNPRQLLRLFSPQKHPWGKRSTWIVVSFPSRPVHSPSRIYFKAKITSALIWYIGFFDLCKNTNKQKKKQPSILSLYTFTFLGGGNKKKRCQSEASVLKYLTWFSTMTLTTSHIWRNSSAFCHWL